MEKKEIDDLIDSLFKPDWGLRELYNKRLEDLEISTRASYDIIDISSRTLKGILEGTQKTLDITAIIKLSDFLQISKEDVFKLYLDEVKKNFPIREAIDADKIKFIKDNFDLAALKKAKFIEDISDFKTIETKLKYYLGLKSIFEYSRPNKEAAFSAGKIRPKNELSRDFWRNAF